MITKEFNLVWYNIERAFQELNSKCEMIDSSIELLQSYRDSMQRTMDLLKNNLNALVGMYGAVNGEGNIKESTEQEV